MLAINESLNLVLLQTVARNVNYVIFFSVNNPIIFFYKSQNISFQGGYELFNTRFIFSLVLFFGPQSLSIITGVYEL